MLLIEIFAIIAFVILLIASVYMLVSFYVCDSQQCKAFKQAEDTAPRGSKEYAITLLGELYNDGIWPFPYIGAAILTPLSLWFIGVPITVKNFAIVFLVSFITIYFLFSFFGHHYVRFVSSYVANYIQTNCPDTEVSTSLNKISKRKCVIYQEDSDDQICEGSDQVNNNDDNPTIPSKDTFDTNNKLFKSFTDGLDVTFAPPINNF